MSAIPPNYIEVRPGLFCHPDRAKEYAEKVRKFGQGYVDEFCGPLPAHGTAPPSYFPQTKGAKPPKRIKQRSKPLLNALEQRYWGYLTMIYVDHPIISQGLKFRLANGCWYCPDFVVWGDENNDIRAFEVKGKQPIQDDSVVKIKVAAKEYHWMRWYLVWWQDGQWKEQLVLP